MQVPKDLFMLPFTVGSTWQQDQMAGILAAAFKDVPGAWPDVDSARAEILEFVTDPLRMALLAAEKEASNPRILGWIGAIRSSPHGWELHPLAVHPAHQGRGIGTALVHALEATARGSGAITLWLGADDDYGGTTLFGQDLYPDVLPHLARLAPLPNAPRRHPSEFYRQLGYTVVGVLPDVDGPGKHDILMAKRLTKS